MADAPRTTVDPFPASGASLSDCPDFHATLRQAGPVVQAEAPAGGPVWIITDDALARRVLSDPRFAKDTALAPAHWHGTDAALEPPASDHASLTTADGEKHLKLRRMHAPAFTSRRLRGSTERIAAIARQLLVEVAQSSRSDGQPADLTTAFTYRFPLTVLCDLLGVPLADLGKARQASEAMTRGTPKEQMAGMAALEELVAAAIHATHEHGQDTLTSVLYDRAHQELDDVTDGDLRYMITGLIFAGHETTGSMLGFLLAHLLAGHLDADADDAAVEAFVEETLRLHPPVPYTLWRFTTTEVELAAARLPAHAPVLIDIEGINTDERCCPYPEQLQTTRTSSPHLTFGDGPHYCIGARLARLEARIAVQVFRADFPRATLALPVDQLTRDQTTYSRRLASLPVWLDGRP